MESHEAREENAVLRQRLEHTEEKVRSLVQALEKRNEQVKEWAKMYEDLQTQFLEAQESANVQAGFVQERNKMITKLNAMIDQLRQESYQKGNMNIKEAAMLHDEIYKQKMQLVDTLQKISQAKIPAEDAFREMGEMLDKKDAQIKDLSNKFHEISEQYKTLNEDIENRNNEIEHLQKENEENEQQIRFLRMQLAEARSGRKELAKIEELNIEVERQRQITQKTERQNAKLKKLGLKLRDDLRQRDSVIEQMQANLDAVMDQNVDMRERVREQQRKTDEMAQKLSKSMENERRATNKFQAKKTKAHNLKLQVAELEARIKQVSEKKTHIAVRRLKNIRQEEDEALKNKEVKLQLRQEIEKRLDAEQRVFDMKDEMEEMKKEFALIKEKYAEAKGADVEPLVELLRELQVEAITIDDEFDQLMEQIPEEPPSHTIEIPESLCDSDAYIISQIMSRVQLYEIENKELRVLLNKFSRTASTYHRVSSVIAKYPILSSEDIGTYQDRGNWVLPTDVEHLQRAVVKLQELLMRKTSGNLCF